MARFYSNENFQLLAVVKLRELGHEVVTAWEAGNANQRIADEAVLAYGISEHRAVLTINRKHFIALHHRMPAHWWNRGLLSRRGLRRTSNSRPRGSLAPRRPDRDADSREPARPGKPRGSGMLTSAQ
jgi:Domain of unknown function (DUF5615)